MSRRLTDLLDASARAEPDRTAVEEPGGGTISYGELSERSRRLSEELVGCGIAEGDRVGILARKSIDTVVSIFGTLKAGAGYVPVDPGNPTDRSAYIFRDCAVRVVLLERPYLDELRLAMEDHRLREAGQFGSDSLVIRATAADGDSTDTPRVEGLSYILYTSGSTGKPKGVIHTHASALGFIDWCSETFEPTVEDRFSSHAPFHFDLSILDLYVPLKHGATLVLIDEELGKQPMRLAPFIAERKLTVWYSTPSVLRLLVEFGRLDRLDHSSLRLVLFAGEVFPIRHLRALEAAWPHPRFFNLYGPTETNVCTFLEIPRSIPEERTEPYPIGHTCFGDLARVIGPDGGQVEPGEEGELLVSGATVMSGYWNLPDRTATVMTPDADGVVWYRTGDVVREDPDDGFLFLGRRDRMVKRRGYRVELGEIEAALYRHALVTEAAVVAHPDEENGVRITAFLSWPDDDSRPSLVKLKQFCAAHLPLYMIPDRFSFQPSLPKTSTDKIDYQRLRKLA